MPFVLNCI